MFELLDSWRLTWPVRLFWWGCLDRILWEVLEFGTVSRTLFLLAHFEVAGVETDYTALLERRQIN